MDYIARGSDPVSGSAFVRNVYASGADRSAVVGQFLDNYRYLPERKGGNALYHEVIVLEPQGHLAPEVIERALHDLAERYCEMRAPRQLAWGRVHHDTDFPHIHLMISANEVRSDARVRMEKAYFAKVQRDLERWRGDHLPVLNARVVYGHEALKKTPKQPKQEGEMVRRVGEPSEKQCVFEMVRSVLAEAKDRDQAKALLTEKGLKLYQRGKTWGVVTKDGRRYRLRTLGMADTFDALPERALTPKTTKEADTRATDLMRHRLDQATREEIDGFERE